MCNKIGSLIILNQNIITLDTISRIIVSENYPQVLMKDVQQFAETIRGRPPHCHDENADIDEDSCSASSSDSNVNSFRETPREEQNLKEMGESSQSCEESESQFQISDTGLLKLEITKIIVLRQYLALRIAKYDVSNISNILAVRYDLFRQIS